ncbi:carbonic anhydrase [Acidovorax sp. 106]|jgi:carbonic anhydrase|uniref:carbonic anhydrase n=1 Tax=Acidovorax sp. 106 TaxID=2135637 RepID=UPI000EADFE74|nr:carbonic anhydrase [Acidovorax sp. 106]
MKHSKWIRQVALASVALCATMAFASNQHAHWAYQGHGGPKHWGELESSFEACARGSAQSPVDIRNPVKADLPALDFQYAAAAPTLVNNGHTVQVNLPAGNNLVVDGKKLELLQFHFHTPSEEAVAGKHAAMVAHFVHKDEDGKLGVVAVLIQPGKTNPAWAPIFAHLPRVGEQVTVDGLSLDLPALLPAKKGYYSFEGSLTTPPCSEGVKWMVLKEPVKLSPQQIKAFRQIYNANARPLQPLNGRVVKESN